MPCILWGASAHAWNLQVHWSPRTRHKGESMCRRSATYIPLSFLSLLLSFSLPLSLAFSFCALVRFARSDCCRCWLFPTFFFVRLLLMWFLRWSSVCAANHANLTQPYVVYDWRYAHSIEIHLLRTLQHRRNPIWQLTGWFVEFCFSHRIMRNEALLMHSTFWKFQCFNMGYFGELQKEWILCV